MQIGSLHTATDIIQARGRWCDISKPWIQRVTQGGYTKELAEQPDTRQSMHRPCELLGIPVALKLWPNIKARGSAQ